MGVPKHQMKMHSGSSSIPTLTAPQTPPHTPTRRPARPPHSVSRAESPSNAPAWMLDIALLERSLGEGRERTKGKNGM